MNEEACQVIESLLVDHLDGELGESDSQRVARHIEQCRACRAAAYRLEQSLAIAQRVWEEAASRTPVVLAPRGERRRRKRTTAAICAASAAVAIVTLALATLLKSTHIAERDDPHKAAKIQEKSLATGHETPEQPDVNAAILREVQAARLTVSARLLASQPGLEEFSDQAVHYVEGEYADTRSFAELEPTLRKQGG